MDKALLAALTPTERLLVSETEPAALALLDEDDTSALHTRVLRARNTAQGVYRRGASGKVSAKGGRGKARPQNTHARMKAEAFEEALGRVSARLATRPPPGHRTPPRDAPSRRSVRVTAACALLLARGSTPATRGPMPAGSPRATRADLCIAESAGLESA